MTHYVRLRWAVRGVLLAGVAASVAANILHADPNGVSQVIAAWPPLALLVTVEIIARVPVHRPWLAVVRWAATAVIAGIAAWVSYWHMVGVVARYGESGATPYLLPLSVDGLVVVASISLVELAARMHSRPAPDPVVIDHDDQADVDPGGPTAPAALVPIRPGEFTRLNGATAVPR